jgi:hypothetical protein
VLLESKFALVFGDVASQLVILVLAVFLSCGLGSAVLVFFVHLLAQNIVVVIFAFLSLLGVQETPSDCQTVFFQAGLLRGDPVFGIGEGESDPGCQFLASGLELTVHFAAEQLLDADGVVMVILEATVSQLLASKVTN